MRAGPSKAVPLPKRVVQKPATITSNALVHSTKLNKGKPLELIREASTVEVLYENCAVMYKVGCVGIR